MTLGRYIAHSFLRNVILVSLAVAGLVMLLSAVENFRLAASQGSTVGMAGMLTLFQMPEVLGESFPLVMMLASLATFLGLSRTSEMVIVRASGVSALHVLIWPVVVAGLIGAVATALFNPVIAASTQKALETRAAITGSQTSVLSFDGGSVWLRQGLESGQTVIQAQRASQQGSLLYGVRLHQFDPTNTLVARVEAESAMLGAEAWLLRGVRRWQLDEGPDVPIGLPQTLPQLDLPTNLTREQILDSFAKPETVAVWNLPGFIAQLERAGFSATRHKVFLQSELARPTLFVAMVLIGAAFSLRHARFGQTGVMVLFAILAGFSLFFFKDIAETLGANGAIPVVLAAWSPAFIAILSALGLLLHFEDG